MLNRPESDNPRPGMSKKKAAKYTPPETVQSTGVSGLLRMCGRSALEDKQLNLLRTKARGDAVDIFYAGDLSLLKRPAVAVVGSRAPSDQGRARASRLARELSQAGVVVVSGLAAGIDAAAHLAAIENDGRTIGIIGTPLERAYPTENALLQEIIYKDHLLLSPFAPGEAIFKSSFPKRNRVMAALTDATVIVEASDTSGTLHQAAECTRLGRWLFILKSMVSDPDLKWPERFIGTKKVIVLESTKQILDAIGNKNENIL